MWQYLLEGDGSGGGGATKVIIKTVCQKLKGKKKNPEIKHTNQIYGRNYEY